MSGVKGVVSYAVKNSDNGDLITITIQLPPRSQLTAPLTALKIAGYFARHVTDILQQLSTFPVLLMQSE